MLLDRLTIFVGLGKAGGLSDELVGQAGLAQIGLGQELGVAAQHDVGTAACHVGGDGDGAELTGLGNDLGFLLVVLGVQHVVGDALPLQELAEDLALFNGDGTHQHGLTLGVALGHLGRNGQSQTGSACLCRTRLLHSAELIEDTSVREKYLVAMKEEHEEARYFIDVIMNSEIPHLFDNNCNSGIEVKYITAKTFADSLDMTDIKRKYLKRYFE